LELVRDYIVAKTAQDCSMMFTLQQAGEGCSGCSRGDGTGVVHDPDTGLSFLYQVRRSGVCANSHSQNIKTFPVVVG
jgi:hypothetical protein